ncbi:hypothetical protein [Snodgrassella sp.]|uniref:hypothetical protein n=1 Tax=Snodgrassella sp. TaxID=2815304 RepID=UPI00258B3B46|nr:hypothetical protein [Snodgrassella sp.]MCO6518402.1 hypothetical protein [Snodgrassella sp.]
MSTKIIHIWGIHSLKWRGWFARAQVNNQITCRELIAQCAAYITCRDSIDRG